MVLSPTNWPQPLSSAYLGGSSAVINSCKRCYVGKQEFIRDSESLDAVTTWVEWHVVSTLANLFGLLHFSYPAQRLANDELFKRNYKILVRQNDKLQVFRPKTNRMKIILSFNLLNFILYFVLFFVIFYIIISLLKLNTISIS